MANYKELAPRFKEAILDWKGVRIYVKMTECKTSGEKLDQMKAVVAEHAGEGAAKMMHAAITFKAVFCSFCCD